MPLMPATGDIGNLAEGAFNDPGARANDRASKTPAVYKVDYEHGPPLRYAYSLAVFRGADGKPELEIDYAIPATELAFDDKTASFETGVLP
jgi:hypothetical protein